MIGDLWAFWEKKIGVAAIICDGLVRDVTGLLKVDIPVFARGVKLQFWDPDALGSRLHYID